MLSLWPGFRGIARYGLWSQLAVALLFAGLLNAFLVANFYWTAVLTVSQRNILLAGLFGSWIVLLAIAKVGLRAYEIRHAVDEQDKTYREAIVHYLRGNWFEAESLILPRLKKNPRDIEMLLLQATLYRHTKRHEEALLILENLQQFDGSNRWFIEIETERQRIRETLKEAEQAKNTETKNSSD